MEAYSLLDAMKRLLVTPLSPFNVLERASKEAESLLPVVAVVMLAIVLAVQASVLISPVRIKPCEGRMLPTLKVRSESGVIEIVLIEPVKTYPLRPPLDAVSTAVLTLSLSLALAKWLSLAIGIYVSKRLWGPRGGASPFILAGYALSTDVYSEAVRTALIAVSLSEVNRVVVVAPRGITYNLLESCVRAVVSSLEPLRTLTPLHAAFFAVWGLVVLFAVFSSGLGMDTKHSVLAAIVSALVHIAVFNPASLVLRAALRVVV